jgi:hypothetical protein
VKIQPTTPKTHLTNPSTHSNLPVKPNKNNPKSNQITKPSKERVRKVPEIEIGAHQSRTVPPPRAEIGSRVQSGWVPEMAQEEMGL